jgi:hypothetical protein
MMDNNRHTATHTKDDAMQPIAKDAVRDGAETPSVIAPSHEVVTPPPANDNVRPRPANDNLEPPPANDNAIGSKKRQYRFYRYTPEVLVSQLTQAGYDASRIPPEDHQDALYVAWCFKAKLYDRKDIAKACVFTIRRTVRAIDHLRFAAKPGTIVG